MREKKKEDNQAYIIPRISPISCTISDRHCGITSFPPFEKFFHFFENCQSVNTISPTNLVAFYNFALCFLSRPKKKKKKKENTIPGTPRGFFRFFGDRLERLNRGTPLGSRTRGCVSRVKTLHLGESRYDLAGLRFASAFIGWGIVGSLSPPLSDESRR